MNPAHSLAMPSTEQPAISPGRIVRRAMLAAVVAVTAIGGTLATPAAADAASPCVYISFARFDPKGDDARVLNDEAVTIRNRCSGIINIRGWKITDRGGNAYRFSSLRMGNGTLTLHVGRGTDRPGHRYWNRTSPVFDNNSEERAYLITASGTRVSTWPYPAGTKPPAPPSKPAAGGSSGAGWSVGFGARPRSGPINLRNCNNVVIENKTFRDLGADVVAIRLENCSNVTIRNVDFINVAEGVFAKSSSNIKVLDSRYSNILGPHERVGKNRANFVQFDHVNGGLIDHNKGKGGDTEDVVSLFATNNVIVEDNHFEGTNWESRSGSGIALGDQGGSNNIARRNILINIGQVGAFISGGSNNRIEGNIIYGAARTNSNVGIYVWNQSGSACTNPQVVNNKVRYWKANGTFSAFWDGKNCSGLVLSGNDFNSTIDPARYRVSL